MSTLEFPVALRDGMELSLRGDPTVTWLLSIVNDEARSSIERTGAFMCLMQAGVQFTVERRK